MSGPVLENHKGPLALLVADRARDGEDWLPGHRRRRRGSEGDDCRRLDLESQPLRLTAVGEGASPGSGKSERRGVLTGGGGESRTEESDESEEDPLEQ